MMHEDRADPLTLRRLAYGDLSEEQDRQLAMFRRAAWPLGELVRIHHTQIDRVISEHTRLAILDRDIDPRHIVLLLLLRRELQKIVETLHPA